MSKENGLPESWDEKVKVETDAERLKRVANLKNQIVVNTAEVVKLDACLVAIRAINFGEFGNSQGRELALRTSEAILKEERSRALERIGISTSTLHEIDPEASRALMAKWRG